MKDTWIVGVSGGPDSMALLHYMEQRGFRVIIAHVNYQKRASSKRDEALVESYAKKHGLNYEVRYFENEEPGNFQKLARDFRYKFYKELVNNYEAKGVVLGHHRDDDVETYFMQKRSNKEGMPGMLAEIIIDDMLVWRPLLTWRKDALVAYCHQHNIEYGVDESNFELNYTRNKARYYLESEDLYDDVYEDLAIARRLYLEFVDALFLLDNPFKIEEYRNYETKMRLGLLRKWLNDKGLGYHFSNNYMEHLDTCILNGKSQIDMDNLTLSISYGEVMLHGDVSFAYTLKSIEYLKNEHFELSDKGNVIEGVTLSPADFPITIRSYQKGDRIRLRYGTKKLNRFFIDRKIPVHKRKSWVVVENCVKEVVFVVKIGCDIYHYSNIPTVFVLK